MRSMGESRAGSYKALIIVRSVNAIPRMVKKNHWTMSGKGNQILASGQRIVCRDGHEEKTPKASFI